MPRKSKKYHYIYKTTCSLTNRFYYGMHSSNSLNDSYIGSGSELSKSVKKYGKENHSKEILEYLNDRKKLKAREKELITEDLRKDPLCMNLAKGGGGSDYALGLITVSDTSGNTFSCHKNDIRYINKELIPLSKHKVSVIDDYGNTFRVSVDDSRYLSGELVSINKGWVNVKDKNGKIFRVSVDDSRYLSGELISMNKDTITVKDNNGDIFRTNKDDHRYISGELVGSCQGNTHSEESKKKIGLANSIKQKGHLNSQYDKCWITNDKESRKIFKGDNIPEGWRLGRKIKS